MGNNWGMDGWLDFMFVALYLSVDVWHLWRKKLVQYKYEYEYNLGYICDLSWLTLGSEIWGFVFDFVNVGWDGKGI
jgi:hypothetical protein